MKKSLSAALAALFLAFPVLSSAQAPDPLANVLALYDFNQVTCDWTLNPPSYCSPCVTAGNLELNRLCQSLQYCGIDGSPFRTFQGWDTCYDHSFVRSDLSSAPGTLSYDVFVRTDAIATISGVSFDWLRPDCSSVDQIEASIFWQDASGAIRYSTTGPIGLNGVGTWNSLSLDFPIDVAPIPTGLDTSGKQFHLELYAWGGNGGPLSLDNVALRGDCAPIPEPNGAVLIAAAGMMILLRRRSRK